MSRKSEAISTFKKSIEIDPFMWNAYKKLCKLEPNKLENHKIYSELNPNIVISKFFYNFQLFQTLIKELKIKYQKIIV